MSLIFMSPVISDFEFHQTPFLLLTMINRLLSSLLLVPVGHVTPRFVCIMVWECSTILAMLELLVYRYVLVSRNFPLKPALQTYFLTFKIRQINQLLLFNFIQVFLQRSQFTVQQ